MPSFGSSAKYYSMRNPDRLGSKTIPKEPNLKSTTTSLRHHGDREEEKTEDSEIHTYSPVERSSSSLLTKLQDLSKNEPNSNLWSSTRRRRSCNLQQQLGCARE